MRQRIEEWDPFGLGQRPKYRKIVMIFLFVAIASIVLSLLIYILCSIFSDRHSKLSEYAQKVREWKKKGDDFRLQDISIALKIMPSENTKGNMIVMNLKKDDLVKETKLNRKYNYSQSYFLHEKTHMYFPVFHFLRENVPVGDSEIYCAHLFWTASENKQILELYDSIKDMPICQKASNPKVIWHDHDPKTGAEIKTWVQKEEELTGCRDLETCQRKCDKANGIARRNVEKKYFCYSYEVLTDICLLIDYQGQDSWKFVRGCFEGGRAVRTKKAVPGKVYYFDNVRVQVRSVHDPYAVVVQRNSDDEEFSFGSDIDFFYTIAFIFFFIAIICGVIVAAAVILKSFIFSTTTYNRFFNEVNS